jgi:hypothetical protein
VVWKGTTFRASISASCMFIKHTAPPPLYRFRPSVFDSMLQSRGRKASLRTYSQFCQSFRGDYKFNTSILSFSVAKQ